MYQALFFSLSIQRSKEAKKKNKIKNNAWSQVTGELALSLQLVTLIF